MYLLACIPPAGAAGQTYQLPVSRHTPVVIAHRGDHTVFPDNSLTAFQKAIELGVDYVEVDVRTTKDDSLIAVHNSVLTLADGSRKEVREMTYAEVQMQAPHIPTFRQVLSLCRNKVNIYLDFKDADVLTTWQLVQWAGMQKQMVVYVNTMSQYYQWHTAVPVMPLMGSVPDSITTADALRVFLQQHALAAVDGSVGGYSKPMLQLLAKQKVEVWLDVQQKRETPDSWNKALQEAPGGLQTDHPAALLRYLQQQQPHALKTRVDSILWNFNHHPEQMLVVAHRADHNNYPENSLPAIQKAIDAGIDIVELDVRETKDKVLVVMHDKDIQRTTNGKGLVSDVTYAELQRFHLLHDGKVTNAVIPRVEEALRLTKGKIMVDLDFKAGTASAREATFALVKKLHMQQEVLFFAYDEEDAVAARQLDFEVPVMLRVHNPAEVHKALQVGGYPVLHIDDSFYSDTLIQQVRLAGLRVWSNALGDYDDKEEVQPGTGFTELFTTQPLLNVVQTNYPEQLLAFLRKKGWHK
ncbi:glycerophosphoryl diester phosphodiesterase [Filimonas lacunae]|nr:glycerophosphoryl diester phosphodiesterase [Filimonas lacunae]